jgi:hypothetical protein
LSLLSRAKLKEILRLPPPLGAIGKREEAFNARVSARAVIALETAPGWNIGGPTRNLAAEFLEALGLSPIQGPNIPKIWLASASG